MGEALRICLFGEPRFEYGGSPHAFTAPPKTLPLLAYLLLHRHAPVSRMTLACALWPESEHVEALANLRRHLHYLNKALPAAPHGAPWVATDSRNAAWNAAAPYWLDVEVFESESQEQRYRAHAVRLYGGELYERCADEWIFFDRERLRSLQMSNLASLSAEARARNAYLQALQYAELMLALDPWREDALRSVLEIRALLGDRAGAAAEYERFAERLRLELGVTPSEESLQLYERLNHKRAAAIQGEVHRNGAPAPIVGRRNELAMLGEEWERAAQGRGRLLLIGGEAGVGKTALVEAIAAIASSEGATVLRGNAGIETPYQAFLDVIRAAGGSTLTLASHGERLAFFDAIAKLLERAAAKPLLIVLEDLHEAGAETFDLLRYLTTRLSESPVLFAATYREYEVGRLHPLRALRRQLARSGCLTHLAVTPLDRESAAELIRARSQRTTTNEFVDELYQKTGGNPLFLVELLHQYAQQHFETIPESVAGIVHRRLEAVSPAARAVAQATAVAGRACSAELAAQVTGLCEGEALAAFVELGERHLVREGAAEGGTFTFVHDIVRETIYDEIPPDLLRRRHERLGMVLRELHAGEFEQVAGVVARHLERGERFDEAAQAYLAAAEAAQRVYALDEAEHCAQRVRALSERAEFCARAMLILESVARSRGNRTEQREMLAALERSAESLPRSLLLEIALRRAEFHTAVNDEHADAALEDLRRYAGASQQIRAQYLFLTGELLAQRGEHEKAAVDLREAHGIFKDCADKQRELAAYTALLDVSLAMGQINRGMLDETTALSAESADPRTAALMEHARGRALYNYDPAAALAAGERMLERALAAGDRWLEAQAHRLIGASAGHLYRLSLAESHLRRAAELTIVSGRHYEIGIVSAYQIMLANRAAFSQAAREYGEVGLSAARACGSVDMEVRIESDLMDTDVADGDLEGAMRRGIPIMEKARRHSLGGTLGAIVYLYGALQVALETPQAGVETLLEARRIIEPLGIELSSFEPILGLAYLCAGDERHAAACADRTAGSIEQLRALFLLPQAYLWAAAQLLHFAGRAEDAEIFAAAAHERYAEILASIEEAPMREAFIDYRFNRAIRALHERRLWAPDPMHAWFLPWDVGGLGGDDAPSAGRARKNEDPKPRAHR